MKKTTEWRVTEIFRTEDLPIRQQALRQIIDTYQRIRGDGGEEGTGECNAPSTAD